MSKKPLHANIFIAGKKVQIPIYQDLKETQRIADLVTERMKKIEVDAERIDTQAFALQAAFEFATEMLAAQEELEADQRELLKALDSVFAHLKQLNDKINEED